MSTSNQRLTDEAQLRDLVESWARAVRTKNLDGIMANHSPEILMFDVPPPEQSKGIEAYRKTWDVFFAWFQDSGIFDIRELNLTAGDDVAFGTALMSCGGTEANGDKVKIDFRLTICFRKIDGRWTWSVGWLSLYERLSPDVSLKPKRLKIKKEGEPHLCGSPLFIW